MPIKTSDKTITIETANTMYQIKADRLGILKHLWYGEKTDTDMEYLLNYHDTGFSGNPYDAQNKRDYSLDTMPQEYSARGGGDYRICALEVQHENGSSAVDLRYDGHKVIKGKYSIPSLPSVYTQTEDEGETLEIYLSDKASGIKVTLRYGVISKYDIITRSAVIKNSGKRSVILKKAASASLDLPYGDWEWIHFHGRHVMERMPERRPLLHGVQESSSHRGTSSHQQNPSVILCDKACTEDNGACIGAALMYSGGFEAKIELDQLNQARLVIGIDSEGFNWTLESGGEFYTPELIMTYSGEGLTKLSQNFHNIIRNNVCRGKYKTAERPVLINNWEATYFNFNADKLCEIAETASELGVDMLVMDDGWFGKRNDDNSSLGDWTVNEEKLGCSLKELTDKIGKKGMKFGIWFEPEMVSENSELYRNYPDRAIQIPGRKPVKNRNQLVLDMTRADVRDYLFDAISKILKSADIAYVKWDMNRSICDWYSSALDAQKMGEMRHRYVLGVYELLERLTSAFPDVLFEGCSGGGGRFDAGMLYYCPQIWCSDNTDAYERTKIQYGTSFFYPVSTMGSHVSAVPNHQTGRVIPLNTRGTVAMAGSFGYELDLSRLSAEEKAEVKEQVKKFKKYRNLIHGGKYFRLSNPLEDNFSVWEFVSDKVALIQGMIFRTDPNLNRYAVKLKGLDKSKYYSIDGQGRYSGAALMSGGVLLNAAWGDYCAVEMLIEEIE